MYNIKSQWYGVVVGAHCRYLRLTYVFFQFCTLKLYCIEM